MSDMLALLRSLAEGVRGMGIGDPDAGERVEASDVIRWAVNEIARLRLTDAEREAVEAVLDDPDLVLGDAREPLRGLLDRLSPIKTAESDRPQPICTPEPQSTPAERTVPPEWTSRPYWVDPPEGWRWGFPKLYDPASDGNMTEWMIRNGYPERLARQGLACTFTACTDSGEK